jgi:hypothetical protein
MFNLIAYLVNTILKHIRSLKMRTLYFELNYSRAVINACHIGCLVFPLLMPS